ncbi:MAG: polysaccharide ABC transporter ATP-binding protein [Flavobacteriales bacterium]|nr:polysaccharide ABC transporter ATP-binding protein [Flavobacteriales bacterium]
MGNVVIKGENLSKQYRLGLVGAGTLREDLTGLWYKIRGKEDPYLKIGDANIQSSTAQNDHVWALKDVNFEVEQGEVLGIIGKNGAGKSTLLKLLSRVTAPTTGVIKARGRVASLLEVGTGFHPELTGRENVYLNGAIMGMRRSEITRKLDEIVEFAGVQRYIDTPVKRYSSGMYVRLAFAVAAHLEPEILIVDEVLAVGDAEFQKKAIGKMEDVSKGHGRTVLFVSHNMKAVSSLCSRCIVMKNGSISFIGNTEEAIEQYIGIGDELGDSLHYRDEQKEHSIEGISLVYAQLNTEGALKTTDQIPIEMKLRFDKNITQFHLNLQLKTVSDVHLIQSSSDAVQLASGEERVFRFIIPKNLLNENRYKLSFNYVLNKSKTIHTLYDVLRFSIIEDFKENELNWYGKTPGILSQKLESTIHISN